MTSTTSRVHKRTQIIQHFVLRQNYLFQLNVGPLRNNEGTQLPVRLFDSRGIHKDIGNEEMRLIIKGHVKPLSKVCVYV